MARLNIEKMSLARLVTLEAQIKRAINEARAREREDVKRKITELAASHGFSINDFLGGKRRSGYSGGMARYANPDDASDTWTGRGRKPNWLLARLKKGAKLEDFAI